MEAIVLPVQHEIAPVRLLDSALFVSCRCDDRWCLFIIRSCIEAEHLAAHEAMRAPVGGSPSADRRVKQVLAPLIGDRSGWRRLVDQTPGLRVRAQVDRWIEARQGCHSADQFVADPAAVLRPISWEDCAWASLIGRALRYVSEC